MYLIKAMSNLIKEWAQRSKGTLSTPKMLLIQVLEVRKSFFEEALRNLKPEGEVGIMKKEGASVGSPERR